MRPLRLTLLALALTVPACSSRSGAGVPAPSRDQRMLTSGEIEEALSQNVMNLYDLIASRRSQWLRPSYSTVPNRASAQVAVWMDNVRLGGADELRNIALSVVVAARYLTPSEAQGALGLDNLGGAIQVSTRRQ